MGILELNARGWKLILNMEGLLTEMDIAQKNKFSNLPNSAVLSGTWLLLNMIQVDCLLILLPLF